LEHIAQALQQELQALQSYLAVAYDYEEEAK